MQSQALARAAAVVLALEGIALLVFAVIELIGLTGGQAASAPTAIALLVLTLVGAGALFAFSFGARRGRTWARSGGVVLQVIAIAIALASLTVPPVSWAFVLGLGVPGIVGFVLLIAASRRESSNEQRESTDERRESGEQN